MDKRWLCVFEYKGYRVMVLQKAGIDEPRGYRIEGVVDKEFNTVAEAMEWIDDELDS